MSAAQADAIVAARIVAVLGAPWVVATNVFMGPVRPEAAGVPQNAIFCLASGGPAPLPYLGGSAAPSFRQPSVQVRIRSAPNDYAGGLATARAASAALDKAALTDYVACQLRQSEPTYLAQDTQGAHHFSVNVDLWLSQ